MTSLGKDAGFRIGGRRVGPREPIYIVAEMSGNHNGDLRRAVATVEAAAAAGADAIKLQTYTADTMTIDCADPAFIVREEGPWKGRKLYDLYREAHTPWEWHHELFKVASDSGVAIFSTPFDTTAVDFLESLDAPAYKIASFELVDDLLLRRVARTRKPVIVSTGMASSEEIAHALATLRGEGCQEILLLKCTSSYPAPDSSLNLASLPSLATLGGVPVGLSDHTMGSTAAVAAVTLGACFVEKHFTLSRADGGVDSHFSTEPEEFRALVTDVRRAEQMLGVPAFGPGAFEEGNAAFRRSLYAVQDISQGEELTTDNVRAIRPGDGLSPKYLDLTLGRRATRDIRRGTPLAWELVGAIAGPREP